jgi:hypothetical protein
MSAPQPVSQAALWTGHVLGVLPCLMMFFSSAMKFTQPEGVPEHFAELGWPLPAITAMGFLEIACTVIYLLPRTAVLGAILLTGYLGGGIAAHVRIGDHATVLFPLILGLLLWGGIYLREPRLRALIPLRA